MTVTSDAEFAKRMMLLAKPAAQFRQTAVYEPDGDCIEFLTNPDPFYAERVDELVTVYYSQETGEVIGSLIKGVSRFCKELSEKLPGFRIVVEDGPIRLEHLFLARLLSTYDQPQTIRVLTYKKLLEMANQTVVEGDLCPA